MGVTVVLDTNIFLNIKNKEEPYHQFSKQILDAVDDGRIQAVISIVSIAELCAGYYSAGDERGKREFITHLASSEQFNIMNLDIRLADAAGRIRAETGLRLPDAIIAASGLAAGAKYVVTHDKEFNRSERYLQAVTSQELVSKL
ncbi:MAG: type II toxin-antitoxin system VapC family toxin [Nitrososphaerales archaeon]